MDLVILGDIICDVVATKVMDLPKWDTDILAYGGIQTMAGGTGLNNAIHAANYIQWLIHRDNNTSNNSDNNNNNNNNNHQFNDMKVHIFSSICEDANGNICKSRLQQFIPTLVDHAIPPPYDNNNNNNNSENNNSNEIAMRTSTCIVISGNEDRCFITDRGCISSLSIGWFDRQDILGETTTTTNNSARKRLLHIAGYYNCDKLKVGLVELLQEARSLGIITTINTQFDSSQQWDGIRELCPHLTLFVGNQLESVSITTAETTTTTTTDRFTISSTTFLNSDAVVVADNNQVEMILAAASLLQWGCEVVVITQGEKGSSAYFLSYDDSSDNDNNNSNNINNNNNNNNKKQKLMESISDYKSYLHICEKQNISNNNNNNNNDNKLFVVEVHIDAYKLKEIVDTTGAGDAFTAGFLVQLLANYYLMNTNNNTNIEIISKCLYSGRKTSSAAIGNIGGSNICMEDLDYFL